MSAPQIEAVVDLDAFGANIAALAACAPTSALMTVVKAGAYGHGMVPMARAARAAGTDWLGVATIDEALALRQAGDVGPLLCWLAVPGAAYGAAVEADVELTASSVEQLDEIVASAPRRPRVQLKVDTGLSRNGARGDEWTALVAAAAAAKAAGRVEVTGLWSHLACADEPAHPANDEQEAVFRAAVDEAVAAGLSPGLRHLANSAATLTRPSSHFDLVRVGIAAYGIPPAPELAYETRLKPVMTLRTRLAQVKRVPAGAGVSYGHQWVADRETTLGLVPMGYGDGVAVAASGRAQLQVGGVRVPLVGRVCMDQLVVDLGDRPARRGDEVVLFGPGHDGEPTAQDWATATGTIAYEVVTRLGGRTVQTYRGGKTS
jgi:alanine racemase